MFPKIITKAAEKAEILLTSHDLLHVGSGRVRHLRPEQMEAVLKVISWLIPKISLQNHGFFCHPAGNDLVPVTVREIADGTGLGVRRVERALQKLRESGFLETRPQVVAKPSGGVGLLVAASLRRFSRKFWAFVGLWERFCRSVRWARENQKKKPLRARMFRVLRGTVIALTGSRVTKQDSKQQREHSRKLSDQLVVIDCLYKKHGGTGCQSPSCSRRLHEICMRLRQ